MVKALRERRARESNPQPLTGHHISSVAASHSLTLQTCSKSIAPSTFRFDIAGIYAPVSKTTPDTYAWHASPGRHPRLNISIPHPSDRSSHSRIFQRWRRARQTKCAVIPNSLPLFSVSVFRSFGGAAHPTRRRSDGPSPPAKREPCPATNGPAVPTWPPMRFTGD